ncbi:MAG: hypothetical protein ACI4S3_05140 [Candidatus Gastranaerophilaceae bacterium]
MRDQKPKYIVPDQVKDRVKAFMNDFMEANNLTKKGLAELMQDKLGRSGCRTSLVKKFSKATFQLTEVMEILDLFDYELKIVPKRAIEHVKPSTTTKF